MFLCRKALQLHHSCRCCMQTATCWCSSLESELLMQGRKQSVQEMPSLKTLLAACPGLKERKQHQRLVKTAYNFQVYAQRPVWAHIMRFARTSNFNLVRSLGTINMLKCFEKCKVKLSQLTWSQSKLFLLIAITVISLSYYSEVTKSSLKLSAKPFLLLLEKIDILIKL